MNIFYNLFTEEGGKEMQYKWFYFKTSPRGKSKFGVADNPWGRLRVFQQGTDEELFLDHLWVISSRDSIFSVVETELKHMYKDQCLLLETNRAGHTEWFQEVNPKYFGKQLTNLVKLAGGRIQKIKLKKPYAATRRSDCPLKFPAQKHEQEQWFKEFWSKIDR